MRRLVLLFGAVFTVLLFRMSKQLQNVEEALAAMEDDEAETAAALRQVEAALLEIEAHFSG